MKKISVLLMAVIIIASANMSVFANDYRRGGHRDGHHNNGLGIAVGVVGGLLLGSALMSAAQPPPPPPVVYVNPSPRPQVGYNNPSPQQQLGYDPQKYYTCQVIDYDANGNPIGNPYTITTSAPCDQYRPAH